MHGKHCSHVRSVLGGARGAVLSGPDPRARPVALELMHPVVFFTLGELTGNDQTVSGTESNRCSGEFGPNLSVRVLGR